MFCYNCWGAYKHHIECKGVNFTGDGIKRKLENGGMNKKQDFVFLKFLKTKTLKDLMESMRKLRNIKTRNMKNRPQTIRRAVHTDLQLSSYAKTLLHLLTKKKSK